MLELRGTFPWNIKKRFKKGCFASSLWYNVVMKETNYTTNIKVGDSVMVNGMQIIVDENCGNGHFWGSDCDGDEIGFTTEEILAIVPD